MDAAMDDDIAFPYSTSTSTDTDTGTGSHRTFGQSSQGYYSRQQYQQNYQQQQQPQQNAQFPFSSVGHFMMWLLDICTGPNFGVIVAVVVIVSLQFKGTLLDFFYNALEDGLQQTLLEIFYSLQDLTRAYYQMTCELLRSLRLFSTGGVRQNAHLPNSRLRTHLGSSPPPLVTVLDYSQEEAATLLGASDDADMDAMDNDATTSRVINRSRGLPSQSANGDDTAAMKVNGNIAATSSQPSSSSSLSQQQQQPQQQALSERSASPSTSSSSSPVPNSPQDEIEPAFLNEDDYPPGWLVYHPILGVVPKEEADQYEKDHSTTTTTTTAAPMTATAAATTGIDDTV